MWILLVSLWVVICRINPCLRGTFCCSSVLVIRRPGFDPWARKIPGEGNGNPLQYSCLENPMDRGAWWTTVQGVPKSWTWLSDWHFHFQGDFRNLMPRQWSRLLGWPTRQLFLKVPIPKWFCLQPRGEPVIRPKVLRLTEAASSSWVVSTHRHPGLYSRTSDLFLFLTHTDLVQRPTALLLLSCSFWVFSRDPRIPPRCCLCLFAFLTFVWFLTNCNRLHWGTNDFSEDPKHWKKRPFCSFHQLIIKLILMKHWLFIMHY